jgi:hypothetical protein
MIDAAIYHVWQSMRQRCQNPKHRAYASYGGRGIYVCSEWQRPEPFVEWALANGYGPNVSIDRVDNDGPYAPWNCRFTDIHGQINNRRNTTIVTAFNETKAASDWARDPRCIVTHSVLFARLRIGWDSERAMTTPVHVIAKGCKRSSASSGLDSLDRS